MSEQKSERIFVYGTLRKGGSNHHRLLGAGVLSAAHVRGRMYRIDWYPGLILDQTADRVVGELVDVSHDVLSQLDAFEGSDYRRVKTIACTPEETSTEAWVWEWKGPTDESQRMTGGDWLAQD